MNYSDSLRVDQEARKKIIKNINTNYFVSASAGSGKTTTLVERMVSMIISGIPVSEICTITFTKAAANEFYSRFQILLSEMCNDITPASSRSAKELYNLYKDNPNISNELMRKRAFDALQNIDLCFMGTIDAFCNMIISEHPMEALVPASAKILDEEELRKFYYDEFAKIDRGDFDKYIPNLRNDFLEVCSHTRNPKKAFSCCMKEFMNHRNFNIVIEEFNINFDDYITANDKDLVLKMVQYAYETKDFLFREKEEFDKLSNNFLNHKNIYKSKWNSNIQNIIKYITVLQKLRFKEDAVQCEEFPLEKVRNSVGLQFSKDCRIRLEAIIDKLKIYIYYKDASLYKKLLPYIENDLRTTGEFNFFDYLYYLSEMLERDSKNGGLLINHIYNRHKYFLIDEFQDTDPLQAKIFFYLTAEKMDPDWRKCIPHKGSLFIVGDDKQSIYHFKGADVAAFLNIKHLFENKEVGEVLLMTQNFRSTRYLKQWFNEVFSEIFKNPEGTQCQFLPIPIKEEDGKLKKLENGMFLTNVYKYKSNPTDDPNIVSKIINDLVGNPKILLPTKDEHGNIVGRSIKYNDIMVITSSKTHMSSYINAFVNNKIPFMIEGKTAFNNCKILCVITSILYSFVYQDYPDNIYSAMSTDGLNISKNRILKYKDGCEDEELASLYKKLESLYYASKKYSVSVVFNLVLTTLELFKIVNDDYLEYIFFTLELLRNAENEGAIITYHEGVDYLNTLVYGESGLERCIALTKEQNRVHIANLHKVKGLQAPIVILAASFNSSHPNNIHIDRMNGKNDCYFIKVAENEGMYKANYFENPIYGKKEEGSLLSIEKKYNEEEKKRLVYVAATRAERILIVSDADNKCKKSIYWKELIDNISDDDDFEKLDLAYEKELVEENNIINVDDLYQKANINIIDLNKKEDILKKTYKIVKPSQVKVDSLIEKGDIIVSSLTPDEAMLQGTMVHKLLESLVSSNNKYHIDGLISEIIRDYPNEIENISDKLHSIAYKMLNGGYKQENEFPSDLFAILKDSDEVITELPFCYKEEDKIIHGVMDLVYRKGDTWIIVDYKTNAETKDLDLHYKGQLDTYIEAFYKLTNNRAKAYIYHIDV